MAAEKGFDPAPPTLVIKGEIDRGSFGIVYSATLDKMSVAVKQFHKTLMTAVTPEENVPLKNFKTECERLKDLNHPNVVRYIGAYEDKKRPLLVMELMHESLEKYLKRTKGSISPERVLEICSSVCEGMAYLHGRDKPLIHRDLGSKNVLLTKEGVVKIADFGQSKLLQNRTDSLKTTQPGTIAYMPPEAMKKGGEYTAKVDSFSLGVLMLEICTQSLPSSGFEGITREIEVIRHEEDLSLLEDAHPLKPLIVWCLQHEKLRPAVAAIHSHVKNVCETSKIELRKLHREKDQSNKELIELQKAIERNEEEREELNHKAKIAEEKRRVAVCEARDLKEQVKRLQEFLDKELSEKREREREIQRLQVCRQKESERLQRQKESERLQRENKRRTKRQKESEQLQRQKESEQLQAINDTCKQLPAEKDNLKNQLAAKEKGLQNNERLRQENQTPKITAIALVCVCACICMCMWYSTQCHAIFASNIQDQCQLLQAQNEQLQSELEYKNSWSGWFGSLFGSSNK